MFPWRGSPAALTHPVVQSIHRLPLFTDSPNSPSSCICRSVVTATHGRTEGRRYKQMNREQRTGARRRMIRGNQRQERRA